MARRRKTPEKIDPPSGQKSPTLLGWCQSRQHGDCWKETISLVCNCKCHK